MDTHLHFYKLVSARKLQFLRYTRLKNGHLRKANSHYLILRRPRTCRFLIRHCVFLQALITLINKYRYNTWQHQ